MKVEIQNYPALVTGLATPREVTVDNLHLLHMAVGIAGESGEVIEAMNQGDFKGLTREFGDVEFYIEGLMQALYTPEQYEVVVQQFIPIMPMGLGILKPALGLLEYIKKIAYYNQEIDLDIVTEFLSALMGRILHMYKAWGIDRTEVKLGNMRKLLTRFPDGVFDPDQAIARKDVNHG